MLLFFIALFIAINLPNIEIAIVERVITKQGAIQKRSSIVEYIFQNEIGKMKKGFQKAILLNIYKTNTKN